MPSVCRSSDQQPVYDAIAESRGLTEEEAAVVHHGHELVRHQRVSEPILQAILKQLGVQGITELTATTGYYMMLGFALNAFDVRPEKPLLPL